MSDNHGLKMSALLQLISLKKLQQDGMVLQDQAAYPLVCVSPHAHYVSRMCIHSTHFLLESLQVVR